MFGKKKKKTDSTHPKKGSQAPSIISQDVCLTGVLTSQGEVQLDGRIDGDIKAHHLVIGSSGVVEGEVDAQSVVIIGKVIGSINAKEVKVQSGAQIHGDIFHDTLTIDAGAIIEGNLKHRFEKNNTQEDKPVISEVKTLIKDDDSGLSFVNKQASK